MKPFIGSKVHDYEFNEMATIVDYIEEEDLYIINFSDDVAIGRKFQDFKIVDIDMVEENLNNLFPTSTNITFTERVV